MNDSNSYKDIFVTEVIKKPQVERKDTTITTTYSDGTSSITGGGSTYTTYYTTQITYQDGSIDTISEDAAICPGMTVRWIYLDNKLKYKVCIQNNLIVYADDKRLINSVAKKNYIPEIAEFLDFSSNTGDYFTYETTDDSNFQFCFKNSNIVNVEKISWLDSNGNSYVNTRLYYNDGTSSLYTKSEFPVMPGWHHKLVWAKCGNKNKNLDWELIADFIDENKYELNGTYRTGSVPLLNKWFNRLEKEAAENFSSIKALLNFFTLLSFFALAYFAKLKFKNNDFTTLNKCITGGIGAIVIFSFILKAVLVRKNETNIKNKKDKFKEDNEKVLRKMDEDYTKFVN